MRQITAYMCDYCKRVITRKDRAIKHEKECFKNPESKSCITCHFLADKLYLGDLNRLATEQENDIIEHKVEGTYHIEPNNDPEGGCDFRVLNTEYEYLYSNIESVHYCNSFQGILSKLRTNCNRHKIKI